MPNFRRHLSSAFLHFNKLSSGKAFICKFERLNVKQSRSRWDGLDLCCLQKLLLSPMAVKELTGSAFISRLKNFADTDKYKKRETIIPHHSHVAQTSLHNNALVYIKFGENPLIFTRYRSETKILRIPQAGHHTPAACKQIITKTRLYNFDPLKPHFYIVKLGFIGVYIIFLIFCSKT